MTLSLTVGQTASYSLTPLDSMGHPLTDYDPTTIVWTVDDSTIVSIGPNVTSSTVPAVALTTTTGQTVLLKAVGAGVANVTVTFDGQATLLVVTVSEIVASSLELTQNFIGTPSLSNNQQIFTLVGPPGPTGPEGPAGPSTDLSNIIQTVQITPPDPADVALNIRGASGALPTPILPNNVSGLTSWFKADAIIGLNDGDPVASWTDSSGNSFPMTQSSPGNQPTYIANSTNSLPGVRFNGSDVLFGNGALGGVSGGTMLAVYSIKSFNLNYIVANTGCGGGPWWTFNDQSGNFGVFRNSRLNNYPPPGSMPQNPGTFLVMQRSSTTEFEGFLQGVSFGVTSADYSAGTELDIGATDDSGDFGLTGDILEVMTFSTYIADSDRQGLESYLSSKWGFTLTSLSQTGNLQQWMDSSGDIISWITNTGTPGGNLAAGGSAAATTYSPANPGMWQGPPPSNVQDALDRIIIFLQNHVPGFPRP